MGVTARTRIIFHRGPTSWNQKSWPFLLLWFPCCLSSDLKKMKFTVFSFWPLPVSDPPITQEAYSQTLWTLAALYKKACKVLQWHNLSLSKIPILSLPWYMPPPLYHLLGQAREILPYNEAWRETGMNIFLLYPLYGSFWENHEVDSKVGQWISRKFCTRTVKGIGITGNGVTSYMGSGLWWTVGLSVLCPISQFSPQQLFNQNKKCWKEIQQCKKEPGK